MMRAVVFAYHDVGVRGLLTLLAHGLEVALVVSHTDNPAENIWFGSVAQTAAERGIPVITPADPSAPELAARIKELAPHFIFSFYYRHMLPPSLLALASRGAYNLHGSLLPKFRGRVPVNWAVIKGERETGATLHEMLEKPDAGRIVSQQRVPILPDDTAHDVFKKVTVAGELCLDAALPELIAGTAPHLAQNLAAGSYFGGRKPEDGRIDWSQSAAAIHNLIRGVAPPYPGAFCDTPAGRLLVCRSQRSTRPPRAGGPGLYAADGGIFADCGAGVLRLHDLRLDNCALDADGFIARFGSGKLSF
jgi:methionyl-tRNA formyltransferase